MRVSAGVSAAVGSDREWLTNDRYRRPGPGRVSATHRAALLCAAPRHAAVLLNQTAQQQQPQQLQTSHAAS